jgi:hypothetical protein
LGINLLPLNRDANAYISTGKINRLHHGLDPSANRERIGNFSKNCQYIEPPDAMVKEIG